MDSFTRRLLSSSFVSPMFPESTGGMVLLVQDFLFALRGFWRAYILEGWQTLVTVSTTKLLHSATKLLYPATELLNYEASPPVFYLCSSGLFMYLALLLLPSLAS